MSKRGHTYAHPKPGPINNETDGKSGDGVRLKVLTIGICAMNKKVNLLPMHCSSSIGQYMFEYVCKSNTRLQYQLWSCLLHVYTGRDSCYFNFCCTYVLSGEY